jgi:hypothetical protein
MADTTGKIAKNLERFAQAVAAHDRENPTHTANGIGLAHFDLERLGLEEGEEILPGITIHADSGVTGNFRVLCDGEHDEGKVESEEEVVEAVATQAVPAIAPGVSPGEIPFGTTDLRVATVHGSKRRGARSEPGREDKRFRHQA